jgi:hypothetical protein
MIAAGTHPCIFFWTARAVERWNDEFDSRMLSMAVKPREFQRHLNSASAIE